MMAHRAIVCLIAMALAGCAVGPPTGPIRPPAEIQQSLLDFLREHNTTGFLVIQHGNTLVEANLPPPAAAPAFSIFTYGKTPEGVLLEDVASQQKSFVAVLVAIAIDKGLIDPMKSVSAYLGPGWSRAGAEREAAIRVIDILTMTSGLDEKFAYQSPPAERFFYNTPVYAITKAVLAKAARQPIEELTQEWLTEPLGMGETAWRQRPAALGNVGNSTALVTTPGDIARFGEMILHGGLSAEGKRVVSEVELRRLFEPSSANPAYGRLWWRNGGDHVIGAAGARREGQLIPGAPADLVAALGYLDRRLYVVPSLELVVVRTGAATNAPDFDQQLWTRLEPLLVK